MAKVSLSVAVNVHTESLRQVGECLSRISCHLHEAKRIVFLDGIERDDIRRIAESLGFIVVTGENLGRNATWHLWWLRMLHFFDEAGAELCLKLDPDSMVDRPPTRLPNVDYFGQINYGLYGFPFVQGGVTGLSLQAVRAIIKNNLLEPGPQKVWFTFPLSPSAAFADDQLLGRVLDHLGIQPASWQECRSQWRQPVPNELMTHSIVHPRYY